MIATRSIAGVDVNVNLHGVIGEQKVELFAQKTLIEHLQSQLKQAQEALKRVDEEVGKLRAENEELKNRPQAI